MGQGAWGREHRAGSIGHGAWGREGKDKVGRGSELARGEGAKEGREEEGWARKVKVEGNESDYI